MNIIIYEKLTDSNFNEHSLDEFIRHQEVKECWRCIEAEWKLIPYAFTEEWSVRECREIAKNIAENLKSGLIGFGAFDGTMLIGYITVRKSLFGSQKQYVELAEFEVSEPYRKNGIGKKLFTLACEAAREAGAEKLYISAHSSKESQAAYRKLGCTLAKEINQAIAENEPCDVQMEFGLL